jgi:hypothetical protein
MVCAGMLVVIRFTGSKHFGHVDIREKGLEVSARVGREGKS